MSKECISDDNAMRLKAIDYFRNLLSSPTNGNKALRLAQVIEHIGRYMKRDLRLWFCSNYPNNKKFFETEPQFCYDASNGEIKLSIAAEDEDEDECDGNGNGVTAECDGIGVNAQIVNEKCTTNTETWTNDELKESKQCKIKNEVSKPIYLCELESIAISGSTQLRTLSSVMHEIECLHVSVSLCLNKRFTETNANTNGVLIEQLVEYVRDIEANDFIMKAIAQEVPHPNHMNAYFAFYLIDKYSDVFLFDETVKKISLKPSIIENLTKALKLIENSIYSVLRQLIKKFLILYGPKDVKDLLILLSNRHHYVIDYFFDNSDDNLYDFISNYYEDFHCKLDNSKANKYRIVSANIGDEVSKLKTTDNDVINSSIEPQIQQKSLSAKNCVNNVESQQLIDFSNCDEQKSNAKQAITSCCVCKTDNLQNSSIVLNHTEFKEFVRKHETCLLRKLIKEMIITRRKLSNKEEKTTQTVSTGVVYSQLNLLAIMNCEHN